MCIDDGVELIGLLSGVATCRDSNGVTMYGGERKEGELHGTTSMVFFLEAVAWVQTLL